MSSSTWRRLTAALPRRASALPSRHALVVRSRVMRLGAVALVMLAAYLLTDAWLTTMQPPTVPVVTAARDLAAGHRLTADDLAVQPVPPGAYADSAERDPIALVGRVVMTPVAGGEPLSQGRLAGTSGPTPPTGSFAMHVPLADPGALAWVQSGDRIDIVDGASGRAVATRVLVLAVDVTPESSSWSAPAAEASGGILAAIPASEVGAVSRAIRGASGVTVAVGSAA